MHIFACETQRKLQKYLKMWDWSGLGLKCSFSLVFLSSFRLPLQSQGSSHANKPRITITKAPSIDQSSLEFLPPPTSPPKREITSKPKFDMGIQQGSQKSCSQQREFAVSTGLGGRFNSKNGVIRTTDIIVHMTDVLWMSNMRFLDVVLWSWPKKLIAESLWSNVFWWFKVFLWFFSDQQM